MKTLKLTFALLVLTLMSCSPEDSVQVETQSVSELAVSVTYWETVEVLNYAFKYDNDGIIKVGQALLAEEGECVFLASDDVNITGMTVSDEAIVLNYSKITTVTFTIEGESLKLTINVDGNEFSEVMTANNTPPCEGSSW